MPLRFYDMSLVRVTIVAFINEAFPGWVECELVDARGRTWKFHEKVPVVSTEDLWIASEYPQQCLIRCTVLERKPDADGREIVTIDTTRPWGIESTEAATVFDVFAEQLEGESAEN